MFRACWAMAISGWLCAAAMGDDLKVSRVSLFSSGVGHFECTATVEGDATAELKFRTSQINDILKSLVLRDLDGGTVSTVQYASRDPVEKALKSFGVDITGRPTLGQLLDQLRGVPVEVQSPGTVRGLITGVEKRTTKTEHGTIERDVLTILTDAGLRAFVLADVSGVKIMDEKIEGELTRALQTLAAAHDAEKKSVVLNFLGEGRRRVRASYLLETPIWKTSYRLVLSDEKKPYLQGWAIVENATEQDWEGVRLSLISGRPISFVMDLYQPLYVPRPIEELDLYRSLRPPTFEGAFEAPPASVRDRALYLDANTRKAGRVRRKIEEKRGGGLGGRAGFFSGGVPEEGKAREMELDDSGVASVATAREAGELFEYSIATPVSLKRRQSAMMPIVTGDIEGSRLSIYNPASHPKHPLNGLRLRNTTGLHLMQGPVTVFDGGLYAGDVKLPDLRPDEERLIAYAVDLAVDVDVKARPEPEQMMQIWIRKGTLWLKRKYVDDRLYTLKNKDDSPRTVLIEQPIGPGWNLTRPEKPDERTPGLLRFKVEVPGKKTATLPVRLEQPRDEAISLTNLGGDRIGLYLRSRVISDAVKAALARVVELRSALDATRRQIKRLTGEIDEIGEEQSRIRQNMKALSRTSDIYRRYERKFDAQETQIEDLHERTATLRKQEAQQQEALEHYLQSLSAE